MQKLAPEEFVEKTLKLLGFEDVHVSVDEDRRRGSLIVEDLDVSHLQDLIGATNALVARHAEKYKEKAPFFDINGYRAQREELITSLAAAAAEKVIQKMEVISLPPMNSYERRLVHEHASQVEGVTSESAGEGKERHVVLSPNR
jgi:spoIIIJ-associated protein